MSIADDPSMTAASLDTGALLEFSQFLNALNDADAIHNNVLLTLMGKMGVGGAAVALPDPDKDDCCSVAFGKGKGSAMMGVKVPWSFGARHGLFALDELPTETAEVLRQWGIELAMPIRFGDTLFSVILLGRSFTGRTPTPTEEAYALLISTITSIALDGSVARGSLRAANRRLERRVHRLRSLFEAGREFNALLAPDAILRLLGYSLMGEMAVQHFAVAILRGDCFTVVLSRFKQEFNSDAVSEAATWGPRIIHGNPPTDGHGAALYAAGVHASIPMEVQGTPRGVLLVGERLHSGIDVEDLEYLCSLANLAIGALENVRLLEETLIKQRLEEDLRIAAEIQQGLLPAALPVVEGFEFAGGTIPTHQVGGDCYDAIELPDSRVFFAISDVSGKGTPASLLMANMQAAVRALAGVDLELSDLVSRVNDLLYINTAADKFVTAFFGILDPTNATFTYSNAGHNPPFLFPATGEVSSLDTGGLILGIMPSFLPYEVGVIELAPGDLLVMYTDGVSEALSTEREEYGEERLKHCLLAAPGIAASEAYNLLRDDVLAFTTGAAQSDDITIVVVRRDG